MESINNLLVMPLWATDKLLILENWQWVAIFILVFISFVLEKIANTFTAFIVTKNIPIIKNAPPVHLKKSLKPFGKLLFVGFLLIGIKFIKFDAEQFLIIDRVLKIILTATFVWFSHRMVDLGSYYFSEQSLRTTTKFDDIIIPLISKTCYVIVYVMGGIFMAHSFTIDVTGLIAGLGIGGLAFAFAAKDTLANFFGSVMLVLDRPFDIGDVITAGDIEGTVIEVGFRSTRIRTFYDSVITISNGELMNTAIDNKGRRRYRRLNSTLGLEYDTPPEKIESFCEGIRELILNHKWTRKDNFHVYFVNFGDFSLDIKLMVFWTTDDYSREQAEKHRLMIDILRLANTMGINFAFPTQTLHLFNEDAKGEYRVEEKYLQDGRDKAKSVTQNPMSLKNPRSNGKDKKQFGDNSVGNN